MVSIVLIYENKRIPKNNYFLSIYENDRRSANYGRTDSVERVGLKARAEVI